MGGVGSGARPRDYPPEMVARVRELYASGLTIKEVQAQLPGCKVQHLMSRYGIPRRPAIKRDQRGENNHMWKGTEANYQALHLRVAAARGAPKRCSACEATDPGRYEWANLTGRYDDVTDYIRLCVLCHRRFDAARRAQTGWRTSPARR